MPTKLGENSEKFHDPSLRMRARIAAQVTVRVRGGTDGRGTLLFLGLTHPGGCGLPSTDRFADCFVAGNGKIQGGARSIRTPLTPARRSKARSGTSWSIRKG
jgi:hypothetical protein